MDRKAVQFKPSTSLYESKKEKAAAEAIAAKMKGEQKMSRKQKFFGFIPPVPPIPFAPWGMPGNQDSDKEDVEENTQKENIKSTVKSAWEQKTDRKKAAADNRKEQWKRFFDYRMEMQDTFAALIPEDTSSLPLFLQMLPVPPKELMERLKEFQIMANDHFMEQADSFNDFCTKAQLQLYDLVTSAMDKADARDSGVVDGKAETVE